MDYDNINVNVCCKLCRNLGPWKRIRPGSTGVEVALYVLAIVAGIYDMLLTANMVIGIAMTLNAIALMIALAHSAMRSIASYWGCSICHSSNVVRQNSPAGSESAVQELAEPLRV